MGTPTNEAQWVLRAQCGDRDALEPLLHSVQPSLRRYVAGLIGPEDADDVLHFALKRVDRSKTIIVVAVVFLFAAVLITLGSLLAAARVDDAGRSKLLFAATGAQMAFVGGCAVFLAFHVSRMTRAVLQAIELAGRQRS